MKLWIIAYCKNNLGDDLFIRQLVQRYPDVQFYMVSDFSNQTLQSLPNLTILPNDFLDKVDKKLDTSFGKQNRILKKCDGTVFIGGSMFMENENWKQVYEYRRKMLDKSRHISIMGINFGPYTSREFLDHYHTFFSLCDDVCVRDMDTYQLFSDISHIHYAPDLVFTLPEAPCQKAPKSICFSLMDMTHDVRLQAYKETYIQSMRTTILAFLEQGWIVRILVFSKYQKDDQCIQKVIQGTTIESQADIHVYDGDIEQSLDKIRTSEYMVATRFHAMILGWIYNCRVFSIPYSNKTENVCKDLHIQPGCSLESLSDITYEKILKEAASLRSIDKIRQKAFEHFKDLDALYKGGSL